MYLKGCNLPQSTLHACSVSFCFHPVCVNVRLHSCICIHVFQSNMIALYTPTPPQFTMRAKFSKINS